jgi:hypothetical protein
VLNRVLVGVVVFACAVSTYAQQNMFKIELVPSGAMVSLNQPTLLGQSYVFQAWPDGASTTLPQTRVKRITRLTGASADTVYQIDLNPSGTVIAKDNPTLKGNAYVFHAWRGGALTSLRKSDVRKITPVTGDQAFWIEQGQMGEASIGNLAMQGTGQVIEIGTPQNGSSQAGPRNASSVNGAGISGAPTYGNWQYQGTPGTSDAYGPANATMSNGVPTMPAATNGGAPPQ